MSQQRSRSPLASAADERSSELGDPDALPLRFTLAALVAPRASLIAIHRSRGLSAKLRLTRLPGCNGA
jgi:hypothetical protein